MPITQYFHTIRRVNQRLTPEDIFVQVLNKFFDNKGIINFSNQIKSIFYLIFAVCMNKLFNIKREGTVTAAIIFI
jgi:hypothetical protein